MDDPPPADLDGPIAGSSSQLFPRSVKNGRYDLIREVAIDSDWDQDQTALRATVKTESGARYQVEGRVLSLIPLRNAFR